jgi:hypothetical protein
MLAAYTLMCWLSTDDAVYEYPSLGGGIRVPLLSPDKREAFFLDVTRRGQADERDVSESGKRCGHSGSAERFSDAGDPWLLLLESMQFVNVTVPPDIRRGLFT